MSFKDNLKSELEYQGIQLKELSAKCGISKNTLGNYITGHNSLPSAETAVKIAQALGVTVEYLVTGSILQQNQSELQKQQSQNLSMQEKTLLLYFEKLTNHEKNALEHYLKELTE